MIKFTIKETNDYDALVKLFIGEGLEFGEDEPVPTELVKCWAITVGEENTLIGGAVLAKRQGQYIIDGIAMASAYQRIKLGHELMMRVIEEVLKLKGPAIYLVARAPKFFETVGFEIVSKDEAPDFFECGDCSQYNVSCHPEVMKLTLQ